MAHAASDPPPPAKQVNERIPAWVTEQIGERGHAAVRTREMAQALSLSQSTAYRHLRALIHAGSLLARRHGGSGLELRLPAPGRP